MGIPLDLTDIVIEYFNIPIRTRVKRILNGKRIRIFLKIKDEIIIYFTGKNINEVRFEMLVHEIGLSIKDAKY